MNVNPAPFPQRLTLTGHFAQLVPLDPALHGDAIWDAAGGVENAGLWQYMRDGPFPTRAGFDANLRDYAASADPLFFAIVDAISGLAMGHLALMRIDARHRVVEVGHVMYGLPLQRSRIATDAMYLLARYVIEDLGYRRYEWKCNALNEASRRAALRLGFTYEGLFRQHMIIKGANRDTAWFSMLDSEWPARRLEFERWLQASNFDGAGQQKTPLRHV